VNLAINLQFLHFHKKITDRFDSWSLAPVIVNGDDVLIFSEDNIFVLNEDQRVDDTAWHCQMSDLPDLRDWTNFVRVVGGFKKSVGKNYISDKFLTINSCLFTRDIETSEWNFIQQIKCPRVENFFNEVWYTHVRATDLGFQREVNTHGAAGFVPKQRRAVNASKMIPSRLGPRWLVHLFVTSLPFQAINTWRSLFLLSITLHISRPQKGLGSSLPIWVVLDYPVYLK
jgi:hypothetical protein